MTVVILGILLAWAYYAPRLVATVRMVRERRLVVVSRPNRLERVAPGDPDTDRTFASMVRSTSLHDPSWTRDVRRASRAANVVNQWISKNRKNYRIGGYIKPVK